MLSITYRAILASMIGERFGKLVVIGRAPAVTRRLRWLCKCDCGRIIPARADALKCGDKKSCGCSQYHRRSLPEILAQAERQAVTNDQGCIEYQGNRGRGGYGKVSISVAGKRKTELIHRVAAAVHLGYSLDDGRTSNKLVLHRCDNPPCFNHKHLFIGTYSDNTRDCVRKGRQKEIKKTHCPKGHPYSGENLVLEKSGKRKCLACIRLRNPLRGNAESRKTHCPQGHPYSGDNLVIEKNGKRKCRTCKNQRLKRWWAANGNQRRRERKQRVEVKTWAQ